MGSAVPSIVPGHPESNGEGQKSLTKGQSCSSIIFFRSKVKGRASSYLEKGSRWHWHQDPRNLKRVLIARQTLVEGGHQGLHFALHGQNLSIYIRTNERLCSRLGSSYLGAVVYRKTQRREWWLHGLPSHNDHGTASMQQALWLGASVPVPVARPVPVPNIRVAWKLVIETKYEPVMIHKYRFRWGSVPRWSCCIRKSEPAKGQGRSRRRDERNLLASREDDASGGGGMRKV